MTLVAPKGTRPAVARAYAISRLGWIRDQQSRFQRQAREPRRQYVERESHYLWGRRYLLSVREEDAKPSIKLGHRRITLIVRPGTGRARREALVHPPTANSSSRSSAGTTRHGAKPGRS